MNCWFLILFASAQIVILAQGSLSFRTAISGHELTARDRFPVQGGGSLTLAGATIYYDISVPLRAIRPAEAHFHGPAIDGENPIISLVPFQDYGAFIRYAGAQTFDTKWLPDIRSGAWYINLHNPSYENGVLSGFIVPVPEPRTITMLFLGASLMILGTGAFGQTAVRSESPCARLCRVWGAL